jgi:SAM-dependent methyltransferase
VLPGYLNVDGFAQGADVRLDLNDAEACADFVATYAGAVEEVLAVHVFEHFPLWRAAQLLREWHALLAPDGVLILELPDLRKCCQNVIDGAPEPMGIWGLYGDPRGKRPEMGHRWGWTPETLEAALRAAGFQNVRQTVPQWHSVGRYNRDMRLEATKT